MGTSLTVRVKRDGKMVIAGELPAKHVLGARSLAKWLELGLAQVTVDIMPSEGEGATYVLKQFAELPGIEEDEGSRDTLPRYDFANWCLERVDG